MEINIRNIILYDTSACVSGFAELRVAGGRTYIKLRHNFTGGQLAFSLVADGESHIFAVSAVQTLHEIGVVIDLSREVFACVMRRDGYKVTTLASGVINLNPNSAKRSIGELPDLQNQNRKITAPAAPTPIKSAEVREIDEILRSVCQVDENGNGICESCPYRDYFFEFTLDRNKQREEVVGG